MIILTTELSLFLIHLWSPQTQHALQDPGAGEATDGAERLHDQPSPTGQPARPAQPRTHGVAQPEATHTQVDGGGRAQSLVSLTLHMSWETGSSPADSTDWLIFESLIMEL